MKRTVMKSGFQAAVAVVLLAYAALARSDSGPLEVGVGVGYTRGHGSAAGGMMPKLQDLAGNGGAVRLDLGWRIDSRWVVGPYAELGRLESGDATDGATTAAAGIQGQLLLAPDARLDPWIGLGAGWRGLWLEHGAGNHVLQGLDLVRVQVGVDYRISPRLAVAPTLGVSFTRFLSEKGPGASGYSDLAERETGHFVFAGLTGRFDVLGAASRD